MTYTLYTSRRTSGMAIDCLLALIGARYDKTVLDLRAGEQNGAAYRRVNPTGKVPALVLPDGQVVTESAAIILTLADRHPEAGLLPPAGTPARWTAYRWLMVLTSEVYPMIEIVDFPERFAPREDGRAEALRDRAMARFLDRLVLIEAAVAGSPWFLSDGPGALDIYLANMTEWSVDPEWRRTHLPKAVAIVSALTRHPVVGPIWRESFSAVAGPVGPGGPL